MSDKYFRVLLDVTDLYLENFKYVWINVSPRELKTISDFKKYVFRKINLERDVQLFVRDGLLLEEETIVVLREDDTVKIKYKSPVCQSLKVSSKESANSSRKRNITESNVSDEDINSKRYKPEIVTLSSNRNEGNFTEKKSKKEKRKKQIESPINSETIYITAVEERKKQTELPLNSESFCSTSAEKEKKQTELSVNFENGHPVPSEENHKSLKKHKRKSSIVCDQTVRDINFCITDSFYSFNSECIPHKQNNKSSKTVLLRSEEAPFLSNDSSPKEEELNFHLNEASKVITDINSEELNSKNGLKRKRKRHRRRKRTTASVTDGSVVINMSESFSENVEESINRKHVVYSSPDKIHQNSYSKDTNEFLNPPTETFVLKDKFVNTRSLDYPKMSTPTQSYNCGVPDWQLSIMPSKNSSLVKYVESKGNDSILHDKSTRSTSRSNRENKSGKKLYENLPDITSLPIVGTYIAYKALELDENYSPSVTDYREGVVERINPDTEELEIRLMKEIILPGRSGKFENLGKDEVPEDTVKSYDVLKWCDIISPKLLSCVPD